MKKVLIGSLAVVGFLCIVIGVGWVGFKLLSRAAKAGVPSKTILEIDLEQGMIENLPEDPLAKMIYSETPVLIDVVEALERASEDDRVVGLVARIGVSGIGSAQIEELRDAVERFREKGKFAVAWSETFGEFGPGVGAYYLATAFDEVYLQPSGDVVLTGVMYEMPFLRGTLDKLDIVPRMDQRYEYKNAMNMYTEKSMTEPHREAMQQIVDSSFGHVVAEIAAARGMSEDEARDLIDRSPQLGQQAVDAKLVDGLAYRDEVYAQVKERAGSGAELLYAHQYLERAGGAYDRGETVALIYGVGPVMRGESRFDPLFQEFSMGSDTVAAAFRDAIDDDRVKAILFRVDSPGGSYVASDTIWRETLRAKEAGKPVIVSMGNLAGSGGYFVAMAADKIVAQPTTITASIGVLGGKMLTKGFWNKLGLTFDEVHVGDHATMWSGMHDYTPEQWDEFEGWLDRVYADFTGKVAEGRDMQLERVQEIAKGRIWSGLDAKRLGLVDELGGFDVALRLAREALELEPEAKIRLKPFPRKKSFLETLFENPASSSESAAAVALSRALETARPALDTARRLGLQRPAGVLSMPQPEPALP